MTEACASAVSNIFAQQTLKRRGISSTGLFEELVVIIPACSTEQTNSAPNSRLMQRHFGGDFDTQVCREDNISA
jgi:hypothetical protein